MWQRIITFHPFRSVNRPKLEVSLTYSHAHWHTESFSEMSTHHLPNIRAPFTLHLISTGCFGFLSPHCKSFTFCVYFFSVWNSFPIVSSDQLVQLKAYRKKVLLRVHSFAIFCLFLLLKSITSGFKLLENPLFTLSSNWPHALRSINLHAHTHTQSLTVNQISTWHQTYGTTVGPTGRHL